MVDAVGEVGEGFRGGGVVLFKEFFSARFVVGEGVERVLFSIFASGSIVDVDVLITDFLEGGLFGGSDAWRIGAVQD